MSRSNQMTDPLVDRFVHVPRQKRMSCKEDCGSSLRCPKPDFEQVSALEEARSAVDLTVCELIPALKSHSVIFEDDTISDEEKTSIGGHKPLRMCASDNTSVPAHAEQGPVGVVVAGESSTVGGVTNALVGLVRQCDAHNIRVLGFSGPHGFFKGMCEPLHWDAVRIVMNRGGSDVLATGTYDGAVDAEKAMKVCTTLKLSGLVVIAGPTDFRWVAELADVFTKHAHPTTVVGIPKSKNANFYVPRYLPITLGFDSARRSLSELAGNIAVDSVSSNKYWHFICCGDAALTMEVSLSIRATMCIAREDLELHDMSLWAVIRFVADLVRERQRHGLFNGVVLLSDGFVKSHSDIKNLCKEIDAIGELSSEDDVSQLSKKSREVLAMLPSSVQRSLLYKRNAEGRCVLPYIEPEKFLGRSVAHLLAEKHGMQPSTFAIRYHYMGREASCCVPSSLDCELGMALGATAGSMVMHNVHGHLACVQNVAKPIGNWVCSALPFASLLKEGRIEKAGWHLRHGIRAVYAHFRKQWTENCVSHSPGPLQFENDDGLPLTLLAETTTVEELIKIVQPVDVEENRYFTIDVSEDTEKVWGTASASAVPRRPIRVDIRHIGNLSKLEAQRLRYQPRLPAYLSRAFSISEAEITGKLCNAEALEQLFPHTNYLDAIQIVPKASGLEGRLYATLSGDEPPKSPLCVSAMGQRSGASVGSSRTSATAYFDGQPRLFHGHDRRLVSKKKVDAGTRALRVGILFGGNQVPGTHTVVAGVFDYLQSLEPKAELFGFLGGWHGLITGQVRKLGEEEVALHRNLGGQDMLCQFKNVGPKTAQDMKRCLQTLEKLDLDGLVVTGHLTTHMDTAHLAEACEAQQVMTRVVACPVSAESDFAFVQQSVGKDTVAKVYSSIIGALGSEAKACRDKWYFTRMHCYGGVGCMLECALQAQVTQVILPDQLGKQSLGDMIQGLCDFILQRAQQGKNFGVILLPDTLLACICETQELLLAIGQITSLLTEDDGQASSITERLHSRLKPSTQTLFKAFPAFLQEELCAECVNGVVDLSNVSTEKLILSMVETELDRRRKLGFEVHFKGSCHELSYQGRSAMPTNFDCDLAYCLGFACGILVDGGRNGYLVYASNLRGNTEDWTVGAIPLISLVTMEEQPDGTQQAVMKSTINSKWSKSVLQKLPHPLERVGINPGPIQFSGLQNSMALTLSETDPTAQLTEVAHLISELQSIAATAEDRRTVEMVAQILENGVRVLRTFKG